MDAIQKAFEHVKSHYPNVIGVVFSSTNKWLYYQHDFVTPTFNDSIDIGLLNEALDEAYSKGLPFVYEISDIDDND
jgi:hypothetical protein